MSLSSASKPRGGLHRRGALLLAPLCAALTACSDPAPPPPPGPPDVTLLQLAPEVVAPELKFTVQVTGCDAVQTVRVLDGDKVLVEQPAAGVTTTLVAPASAVDFKKRGLSAAMSISAEGACADGRSAKSQAQGLQFLPASERYLGPWPFKTFWVEETGDTFLGCGDELTRFKKDGTVSTSVKPNFPCAEGDSLTFGSDGARYLLQPDRGLFVFAKTMSRVSAIDLKGIEMFLAPGAGSTLYVEDLNLFRRFRGFDRTSGNQLFVTDPTWTPIPGRPLAPLRTDSQNRLVWVDADNSSFAGYLDVSLERYGTANGGFISRVKLGRIKGDVNTPVYPTTADFDSAGSVVYLPDLEDPGTVAACDALSTVGAPAMACDAGKALWRSPRLAGGVTSARRVGNLVAAIGPRVAYFLDATTGAQVGQPVLPTDPHVFTRVVHGADGSLYLLGRLPDQPGYRELVVMDSPGNEVARHVAVHGYEVDVDPKGQAWLLGDDLVRLLPAADYRKLRP